MLRGNHVFFLTFFLIKFFYWFLGYKPGLPIPKLDPYVSPCPFVLESTSITSILNAEIHWENITVYGAQNAVVQKIRYH